MLNWLRSLNWFAFALAAVFVAFAFGASCFLQRSQPQHSNAQTNDSRRTEPHAQTRLPAPIKPIASRKAPGSNGEINCNSCLPRTIWQFLERLLSWWIHDPNAFFGSWVAVFTGLLVYRTVLQDRSNIRIERAYLSPELDGVITLMNSTRIEYEIRMHNSGKTPATVIEVYAEFADIGGLPKIPSYEDNTWRTALHTVIPVKYSLPVGTLYLSKAEVSETIFGYVKYRDVFGGIRHTYFAIGINTSTRLAWRTGGDVWNSAD